MDSISACTGTTPNYTYNATVPLTGGGTRTLPHAVGQITGTINGAVNPAFTYDKNGNMTDGLGRSVTWTSFNMPESIKQGGKTTSFLYNGEHERIKEHQADGSDVFVLSPRYDTGLHFEKKSMANGVVEYEYYLYAGGLMFGKYIEETSTNGVTITVRKTEYYNKDHLGSIVAITDEGGTVVERLSYDVWGKRRNVNGSADPNGALNNPDMYHGFTGHEMLDAVGLIHMNGRLFDPLLGRFVSADPTIQAPNNLQSYNRYSYGWNNPLGGTDPSGFSFWTDIRDIALTALTTWADMTFCGGACSAVLGAYRGSLNGGGLTSTIVGAVQGYVGFQIAVTLPLTNDAGIIWQNVTTAAMVNAATGCVSTAVAGGDCGRGAISSAMRTVGAAYGNLGSIIAGCAAGQVGGGSCHDGVVNALETYAVYSAISAVKYIKESASRPQVNQFVALPAAGAVLDGLGAAAAVTTVGLAISQIAGDIYDTLVYSWNYRERALIDAGIDPNSAEAKNYEVHHVVQQGHLEAAPAVANLAAVGIGVHDLENLVVLRKPHQGVHTKLYRATVNAVTTAAVSGGYNKMVDTLNNIKSSLVVKGSYP